MNNDFLSKLNKQWKSELPFVIFSLPFQKNSTAYLQDNNRLIQDPQLEEQGFVFGGFDSKETIFTLINDQTLEFDQVQSSGLPMEFSIVDQGDKSSHINRVQKAVDQIKSSALEKVVLARTIKAEIKANPLDVYAKLNQKYPNAFTYCLYHPKVGFWLGASPELLISISGDQFNTVSLAGTRWAELSDQWGQKEKEEQQLVTRFIQNKLDGLELSYECSEVKTIQAGNLLHLKQDFRGQLNNTKLKELIAVLHPTPAVCGMPSDLAKVFITENEAMERSYYAGFMGPIHQNDQMDRPFSYLGVNIRSMTIENQTAQLFVGGGITVDSIPELEWEETVKKSKTLSSIFE